MSATAPSCFAVRFAARGRRPRPHQPAMLQAVQERESVFLIAPTAEPWAAADLLLDLAKGRIRACAFCPPTRQAGQRLPRCRARAAIRLPGPIDVPERSQQMTVSSDLICAAPRRYQPDPISLRATRADTASGVIDLRHGKGRVVQMASSRVSPLAIPVLPEIDRASVRFAVDEDALLAKAETVLTEMQAARDGRPVGRLG